MRKMGFPEDAFHFNDEIKKEAAFCLAELAAQEQIQGKPT